MPIQTEYSHHLSEGSLAAARAAIADTIARADSLRTLTDVSSAASPGKWSRKELLGHLVDSALNNTQRFVRAQIPSHLSDGVLRTPGYAQNDWVRVGAYERRSWPEIFDLWAGLNRNILHIIDNFDRASLATPCAIGEKAPIPIEHVIVDYAGHLVHHYKQIIR